MTEPDFDAILHNWIILRLGDDPDARATLVGQITADRQGRFPDGRWIMTSVIIAPTHNPCAGEIVVTRNTRYWLAGSIH